ncbi:MAG: hypothetical protein AAGA99_13240 [Actinomycetota bacterium]
MTDWTKTRAAVFERMDTATRFAYENRAGFPRIDEIDLSEHRALAAAMAQRAVDAGRTDVAAGVSVEEIEIPAPGGPIPTLVYVPDQGVLQWNVMPQTTVYEFIDPGYEATLTA